MIACAMSLITQPLSSSPPPSSINCQEVCSSNCWHVTYGIGRGGGLKIAYPNFIWYVQMSPKSCLQEIFIIFGILEYLWSDFSAFFTASTQFLSVFQAYWATWLRFKVWLIQIANKSDSKFGHISANYPNLTYCKSHRNSMEVQNIQKWCSWTCPGFYLK